MVEDIRLPNLDMEILREAEETAKIQTSPIRLEEDVDEYLKKAVKEVIELEKNEKEQDKELKKEKKKANNARKAPKRKNKEPSKKTAKTNTGDIKTAAPVKNKSVEAEVPKTPSEQQKILDIFEHCMKNTDIRVDLKSPIKWAGGKSRFYKQNKELFKTYYEKGNKYIEPFLGGGACLFGLAPEKAIVGDVNGELVNFYTVVKHNIKELVSELSYYENTKEFYYMIRAWDRDASYNSLSPVQKAARFYYINQMGYNGLYRVNLNGENNTPYGHRVGPFEPDVRTLVAAHLYLNKNSVEIKHAGFRETLKNAEKGDLVYLDPPMYDNSFKYNKVKFTSTDFEVLKLECDILTMNKIAFIMTSTESRFIRELFYNYRIKTYTSGRSISSKGSKRSGYDDLIITNF